MVSIMSLLLLLLPCQYCRSPSTVSHPLDLDARSLMRRQFASGKAFIGGLSTFSPGGTVVYGLLATVLLRKTLLYYGSYSTTATGIVKSAKQTAVLQVVQEYLSIPYLYDTIAELFADAPSVHTRAVCVFHYITVLYSQVLYSTLQYSTVSVSCRTVREGWDKKENYFFIFFVMDGFYSQ